VNRVTETVAGSEEKLVPAFQDAVRKLIVPIQKKAEPATATPSTTTVPPAATTPAAPPGEPIHWGRWLGLGGGIVLVGVGVGVFGTGAQDASKKIESNLKNPDPAGDYLFTNQALKSKYTTDAWLADGFVAGGVALGVVSVLFFG